MNCPNLPAMIRPTWCRVVPLRFDASAQEQQGLLAGLNGVLFPGLLCLPLCNSRRLQPQSHCRWRCQSFSQQQLLSRWGAGSPKLKVCEAVVVAGAKIIWDYAMELNQVLSLPKMHLLRFGACFLICMPPPRALLYAG
jgi:hypothetical protein